MVYEICWYLRGLEQWFMDLLTQPEFCEALLDQTLKFWLDWFRLFLDEVGDLVDVIMIGDDLAGQNGPAVPARTSTAASSSRGRSGWCSTSARGRRRRSGITPAARASTYIPDLLDNGIDILNPVQISADGHGPGGR